MKFTTSLRAAAGALLLAAIVAGAPRVCRATPVTVPTGLNLGDQYRLAFVTSTVHDAQSSDIADYNAFVTAAATAVSELAALGTTWTAIGSTLSIDARDNTLTNPTIETGVPIYNLGDARVADDNADLWDGAIQAPIQFDETGSALTAIVHTGTDTSGQVVSTSALGMSVITAGDSTAVSGLWIANVPGDNPFFETSLYAISGVLTVVPEPGTLTLLCLGAAGLAGAGFRRRRGKRH